MIMTFLGSYSRQGMGQTGHLESCEDRFVGPAELAEVVKWLVCVHYIDFNCRACLHMPLQEQKHQGQRISNP